MLKQAIAAGIKAKYVLFDIWFPFPATIIKVCKMNLDVMTIMCKSYLKLAKEFQGRSYDMMNARTTIVFSRYIMLAVENRSYTDLRTIGALFYY
jgi:hypothetical protein